jgi:hypothetical protein
VDPFVSTGNKQIHIQTEKVLQAHSNGTLGSFTKIYTPNNKNKNKI